MKLASRERYKKMHLIKEDFPMHNKSAKQHISTPFWLSPEIRDYEPQFLDPPYQQDPYWSGDL